MATVTQTVPLAPLAHEGPHPQSFDGAPALSFKLDTTLVHVDTSEADTVGHAFELAWDSIP